MDGRNVKATETDFKATNKRIVEKLFGDKEFITVRDFFNFRDSLQEALWHFEFHQFDVENDQISAEDFSRSILICMPFNKY